MTVEQGVSILMYHSIANGGGPLAIRPAAFRRQLDLLADRGFRGIALRDYIDRFDAGADLSRVAVLTFDDGYRDFAEVVVPEMAGRGWSCTVFLSSDLVGSSSWDPDGNGRRALIDWDQAVEIAHQGIEIGAHGVTHRDLTRVAFEEAVREIDESKQAIESRLGLAVTSFAAPYGHLVAALRARLTGTYRCAVGTAMARATSVSDRYDLPRIDMWYFRSAARWEAYLDGARTYFAMRRALRRVRHTPRLSTRAR